METTVDTLGAAQATESATKDIKRQARMDSLTPKNCRMRKGTFAHPHSLNISFEHCVPRTGEQPQDASAGFGSTGCDGLAEGRDSTDRVHAAAMAACGLGPHWRQVTLPRCYSECSRTALRRNSTVPCSTHTTSWRSTRPPCNYIYTSSRSWFLLLSFDFVG